MFRLMCGLSFVLALVLIGFMPGNAPAGEFETLINACLAEQLLGPAPSPAPTPGPAPSPDKISRDDCTICKGTGWVYMADGNKVECQNCEVGDTVRRLYPGTNKLQARPDTDFSWYMRPQTQAQFARSYWRNRSIPIKSDGMLDVSVIWKWYSDWYSSKYQSNSQSANLTKLVTVERPQVRYSSVYTTGGSCASGSCGSSGYQRRGIFGWRR